MSRRMFWINRGFSSCWVALRNRSRNSSSRNSPSRAVISEFSNSRISSAFMRFSSGAELLVARDEARLDRQLGGRQVHGLARRLLVDPLDLEQHATGLHDGDPSLRVALPLTHARLGRLLRDRLV